ncbi:MAG: cytochrome-c peroxidase [Myxococcales bacterium FL481]|nr:MAG: cytochrome-c peroxidase [Myxococcales bacterium FL481]
MAVPSPRPCRFVLLGVGVGLIACGSPRPDPGWTTEAGSNPTTSADASATMGDPTSVSGETSASSDGGDTDDLGSSTSSETGGTTSSTSAQDPGTSSDDTQPEPDPSLDEQLAAVLSMLEEPAVPLEPPPPVEPALFALGEALFFDPILSGNKDIACATCHHPQFGLSDGLALALGTGAVGLGPERADGDHPPFIPRHSQSLFNIGDPSVVRLFWDGRVEAHANGDLTTPAGDSLLPGVSGALAAQAMFPVVDRLEMRGQPGDVTILGEANEIAALDDTDYAGIWAALTARLADIDGYVTLFAAAYPEVAREDLTFAHAANAIAAYETEAFSFPNSPWDQYLRGDTEALTDAAKMGAIFYYTFAGCGRCHSGPLLTDHEFHNTGIVQLGPGKSPSVPYDLGRANVTGAAEDRYGFRTPSLRNFVVAPPFMHNGSLTTVGSVTLHYRTPRLTAVNYDPSVLHPDLHDTVQLDAEHLDELLGGLAEELSFSNGGSTLPNVMRFVEHLHDPAVASLPELRPTAVPSGLEVP